MPYKPQDMDRVTREARLKTFRGMIFTTAMTTPIAMPTVLRMVTAIMIRSQGTLCIQGLPPTPGTMTLENHGVTKSIALIPTDLGRILGHVLELGVLSIPTPLDRLDQGHYSSSNSRRDNPHRSCSKDRSRSYHSRDRDRHAHHRESSSSPQGRRDSFISSLSSYEE